MIRSIIVGLLLTGSAFAAEAMEFEEGTHYQRIAVPVATADSSRVEVVEAFSYGVPCIGFSDCDGVRHLIQDGKTGLLVDRDDPDGLAGALRKVADPEFRQFLSDSARRFANDHLSYAQWRAHWLQMIDNAAGGCNNQARPQLPAAYDPANPRSQHWRDLLRTFIGH